MTVPLGNGVVLITREEWGARKPRSVTRFTPNYGSTTHWEGPHMGVFPHTSCATKVRGIQAYHMDVKKWSDIAYSWVTCPHGYVFEGRWFGVRTAANGTTAGNSSAYAGCYLGGEGDGYTEAGKLAQRSALDYADRHGSAGPGRNCHRDWKPTQCPGDQICAWVRAGQPAPIPPSPTPKPPIPEDEDMAYRLETGGGRCAYVIGDLIVDVSWENVTDPKTGNQVPAPLKTGSTGDQAMRAVFLSGRTNDSVPQVHVDRAQQMIARARGSRDD